MIKIVEGNILDFEKGIIVHQVNCFTMGSGVAKALYTKYPQVKGMHINFIEWNNYIKHNPLGNAQIIKVTEELNIANLFGQYNYGYDGNRYTNYIAFTSGLSKILLDISLSKSKHNIAIPYNIGCDRGGADWNRIYNIIETLSLDFPNDIYIYKYNQPEMKIK